MLSGRSLVVEAQDAGNLMPLNDRLRKQWKAAGYERGHGSDAVLPPPPPGFTRLYYLTGPDHAISNIVFGRIKISRFSQLNDPFELLGQNFGDANIRKLVRDHKNKFNNEKGIICFSADWTDPVLWSHYAAKHKGIALGFDVEASLAKEVQYSSARLKFKMPKGTTDITSALADLLICTKFESWSYEREWRLLRDLTSSINEGGLYFMPFSSRLKLVEVILGSLCDFSLPKIRALVDASHEGAMTYKARLAYRSFRVIPKGSSVTPTNF
jgi:Protein of unknown function (DUF2971)